jgi:hypothetical protein
MVILVQVLRRRLLRQAVIVKIKVFLPKKSMSRFHMWWLSVLTFVDCLEKSERLRIMLRESAYLVRMTRLVMLLLVSVHSCLSAPQRIKGFLDTEDGHEMSRSSSVSTKDRSGKRGKPAKQRREDSDSFDVRSQYTPFFPQQAPTGPTWAPTPQYPTMMPQQFNGVAQNIYPNTMPPQFAPQSQSFNSAMINNGNMQTYSNMQQVMNNILYNFEIKR